MKRVWVDGGVGMVLTRPCVTAATPHGAPTPTSPPSRTSNRGATPPPQEPASRCQSPLGHARPAVELVTGLENGFVVVNLDARVAAWPVTEAAAPAADFTRAMVAGHRVPRVATAPGAACRVVTDCIRDEEGDATDEALESTATLYGPGTAVVAGHDSVFGRAGWHAARELRRSVF